MTERRYWIGMFADPLRRSRAICALALAGSALFAVDAMAHTRVGDGASRPPVGGLDGENSEYQALWRSGELVKALELLDKKIEDAGQHPPIKLIYHRGELRFATGRVDEAIVDLEYAADQHPEPAYTVRLADMYYYRGRLDRYEETIGEAQVQVRGRRWIYSRRPENYVAAGRLFELQGKSPKEVLATWYGQVFDQYPNQAPTYVGAGDMAYSRAGYDVAAGHYEGALELDSENQDALSGLAECYWKSHDERLGATLDRLLNINPHHPRARAIKVEQLLDGGKVADALELIEKALAINPTSIRFRSLKSAAYFIDGDEESMQGVIEDLAAFNPRSSDVYRTTGRLASRHYRFKEGAEFQRKALEANPDDFEARALYTLDLMRRGEETEGREELEKAFEADPYNVQIFNLLELMDTLSTFATFEEPAFTLRLPRHEAPLISQDTLNLLNRAITHFEAKYEIELEKPVHVQMFDNHDDFMVRSVGLPGNAGHLGICFGKLVTLDSPSARPRGSWNWRSVLWHEFMHVITLQKTNNRMPRWLSEGISVYEEGQFSRAWRNKLDPDYRVIIAKEGLPKVIEIGPFFTEPKSSMHLMFGYFIAGEFVQHYVDTYGFEALKTTLDAIGLGAKTLAALNDAAGTDREALDEGFRDYLEERLKPYDNLPVIESDHIDEGGPSIIERLFGGGTPPQIAEDKSSSPFTDAMKAGAEAVQAQNWERAEAELIKAHDLFPDYTGDDAPLRQLVQLYERVDNRPALKETLFKAVEWTPDEIESCRQLVAMLQEDEEWEELVRVADWAVGIDPYDVEIRKALTTALITSGHDEEALQSLDVLAHLDSPRANEHRLDRIELLAKRGELQRARKEVIAILEELPHYWRAQQLLLEIVERDDGHDTSASDEAGSPDAKT